MITPPTDCFYVIQVKGEAAEFIASTLSPQVIADIQEAVLISENFSNDVQANVSMDATLAVVKQQLHELTTELTEHNPLYVPCSATELDDVLEGDMKTDSLRFTGMDGSPFTMRTVSVLTAAEHVIEGSVSCRPFNLPSYSDIIKAQDNFKLN